MIHASLCTGIGAAELAATWMGWINAFSCEIDEFCNTILKYYYPNSKHYGNIFEQDFREWKGRIDVLTAGFPCQPFSVAGARNGAEDDRYLWPEVLRVVNEVRPAWFIGENVSGITSMVLPGEEVTVGCYTDVFGESYKETEMREQFVIDRICNDLEGINYSVQPIIIPACAVGAPHRRDRVWFIANRADTGVEGLQREGKDCVHATGYATHATEPGLQGRLDDGKQENAEETGARVDDRLERYGSKRALADSNGKLLAYRNKIRTSRWDKQKITIKPHDCARCWKEFPTQSPVCNGNDGVPGELFGISFSKWRQESIKALGNSMVPQVVYEIFLAIEQVEKTFNKKTI